MTKTVKLFIFAVIFALLAILGIIWKYKPIVITGFFQSKEYARGVYQKARDLQLNNEYKSAYYTYGKISGNYKIYDIVLYHQADCAAGIEDEKTAVEKYKKILKLYSDNPIAPIASYKLGQTLIRMNKNLEAQKQFLSTIENFPGTDYAVGSFYYLGELNKKIDPQLSSQYFLKYIALAPAGNFAIECYKGLKDINYKFNEKDKLHIGIALFMQQEYRDALKYLNQLPRNETWYYRGICHKFLGEKSTALAIFKKAVTHYINDDTSPYKVRKAMQYYVDLNYSTRFRSWSNILHWTDRQKDFALYNKAILLSLKNARKLYEEIYEDYPDGNYASESLWKLFWYEYDTKDYDDAVKHGESHLTKYESTKASPAIRFWMGKIYEKKDNLNKAKKYYELVLKRYPDSYYAFRANGRLKALNGENDTGWMTNKENRLPVEKEKPDTPYSYKEIAAKHGEKIAELILLKDYDTAMLFMPDDSFLESWIKLEKDVLTSSIVSARKGMEKLITKPTGKDPRWKLIYPIYYPEIINKNAKLNGLDPVLVISLMKEESHFNPFAVSSSNARGLMQVLPITAKDIVRWKRLKSCNYNELFDPETNIRIGTAYLSYTEYILNENPLLSVAAYNAGPTAVKSWLNRFPHDDFDRFIENIPYNQTRRYVKKVYGSYWNYKRIYKFE